jgi:hypothetical protein
MEVNTDRLFWEIAVSDYNRKHPNLDKLRGA